MWNVTMTIVLSTLSGLAFAGNSSGGGGGGSVVCRGEDHKITSAQLLDLYEGSALYGYKVVRSAADIDSQLAKIANVVSKAARFSDGYDLIQKSVQERLRVLPEGVRLEPINDAFPIFAIKGCAIEQFARYTEWGDILVDAELWNFFKSQPEGETDIAALVVHETIYSLLRALKVADNSKEARRIVAALFSDKASSAPFSLYNLFNDAIPLNGNLLRFKSHVSEEDQEVVLAFGAKTFTNEGIKYAADPIEVAYEVSSFDPKTNQRETLAQGTCTTHSQSLVVPCDFLSLKGLTQDGKFLYVEAKLIGMDNWYLQMEMHGVRDVLEAPLKIEANSRPDARFVIKPWRQ